MRPIWNGSISFGLLQVPVQLFSATRDIDLHFRMLDGRDNKPIRYERVNEESGHEVPWKEIVKAFEYSKGSYVVLEPEDIKSAAAERREAIDIEAFVAADAIGPQFFEKPYFLVPGKKAEKGYVLLRETLRKTKRVGIGRVVIRTREYLCAVMPQDDALIMLLLRYPQELVTADNYSFPGEDASAYRITTAELAMAGQLIESMSGEWKPGDYKDDFRERLTKVIEKRMKAKGVVQSIAADTHVPEDATTNVVDFVSLLKKSLATKKSSPAKGMVEKVVASPPGKKAPAKKAASTIRKKA